MTTPLTLKVQTWGDDLRLPCLINAAETAGLLSELEPLRRPSIPFQSKHLHTLKRNKWFVLKRPADRSRSGFVVVWPERQACVYVSGDLKRPGRIALLRLRIDPQLIATGVGLTVFAATLSAANRQLMIEDTLIWKGRSIFTEETFSKRWALAIQWIEHYCILDERLLNGLKIEMASWDPLTSLRAEGVWELQADEPDRRRCLWIASHGSNETVSLPTEAIVSMPILESAGPLIAVASREAGPEQWALASSDGVSLGRALIRTLAVSDRLRSSKLKTVRVEVGWNEGFHKWEVKDLSEGLASPSAKFDASK